MILSPEGGPRRGIHAICKRPKELGLESGNETEWKLAKSLEGFFFSGLVLRQGGGGEGRDGVSPRSRGTNGGLSGGGHLREQATLR